MASSGETKGQEAVMAGRLLEEEEEDEIVSDVETVDSEEEEYNEQNELLYRGGPADHEEEEEHCVPLLQNDETRTTPRQDNDKKEGWVKGLLQRQVRRDRQGIWKIKVMSRQALVLGLSLALILGVFWLLDSLKDAVFDALVGGKLNVHQPRAKLMSVMGTLLLVCALELTAEHPKKEETPRRRQLWHHVESTWNFIRGRHNDADDGSAQDERTPWRPMEVRRQGTAPESSSHKSAGVPTSIFFIVGVPYIVVFWTASLLLRRHPAFSEEKSSLAVPPDQEGLWAALGYVLYFGIESYGSIAVASFWSYSNSHLGLEAAGRWYGPIIGMAQLGAILGSTVAAAGQGVGLSVPALIGWSCVGIGLQALLMQVYTHYYLHDYEGLVPRHKHHARGGGGGDGTVQPREEDPDDREEPTLHDTLVAMGYIPTDATRKAKPPRRRGGAGRERVIAAQDSGTRRRRRRWQMFTGVQLIWKHNYLLLILGVSCLYEISLTCLDYEMKLVGLDRFRHSAASPSSLPDTTAVRFSQFMGRYGQLTNGLSLLFSYFVFPWLMRTRGLRRTLRLFPLVLVAVVSSSMALPLHLPLLFASLSLLKALTFGIHDPAKEILYQPTSDEVKFRAKFWMDVVGARMAKALGSFINHSAQSPERTVRLATLPSIATSLVLLLACFRVGQAFEEMVALGHVVGKDDDDNDDDDNDDDNNVVWDNTRQGDWEEESVDFHVDDDDDDKGWESNATIELSPQSPQKMSAFSTL